MAIRAATVLLILAAFLSSSSSSSSAAVDVSVSAASRRAGVRAETRQQQQKLSHLRFFFHDVVSGRNPSAVPITLPVDAAAAGSFGMVYMMDDLLTEGAELTSRAVGRAQGFYASADRREAAFLQAMNLVFTGGKYNGSTVTLLGRNAVMQEVREMPVIGGSGLFRFARGYAAAHTRSLSGRGDAVVEYNVYVMHY